jgi:biopolymer transport protein ExbB
MVNWQRVLGLGMAGVLAAPGWAATGGTGDQSLLDTFWRGIEWPAYFILAGSVAAIALVIEHFLTVRRSGVSPQPQIDRAREQIEQRKFRECLNGLQSSHSFFAQIMTASLVHARHGFDAMHAAALEKSGELSGRMFRKVEYLNILGNLGPLLGLLGTVWGMIIAFGDLGSSGGAAGSGAGELARGISLALVNTLLGLALAIIGLGFFGVARNRVDSLTTHATVEALDLLEYFRPSARRGGGSAGSKEPAAAAGASE